MHRIISTDCIKKTGIALFLLAGFLAAAAWAAVGTDKPEKTLTFSWPGNVGPLNPHLYSPNQMFGQAMVYEPLVKYERNGSIKPCLAQSWAVSPDGLAWTFSLKRNVVFSDGTPFNARAVKMNLDAVLKNGGRHTWLELVSLITKVQVLDELTVRVVLKKPYAPILQDLALVRPFRFLAPSAFPADGDTSGKIKAPVGTGPWTLAATRLGEYDVFRRNERYWGVKPAVSTVTVKVISDPNTCAMGFETGELDLIYGDDQISLDTFDRFRHDSRYVTGLSPPMGIRTLALNTRRGPTRDIAVRLAIQHAVNKDSIVRGIFLGTVKRADTLLPGSLPYCAVDVRPYTFDPALAGSILDKAGWVKKGRQRYHAKSGTPLSLDLCFVGKSVIEKSIAEVVQANLQALGFIINLKGVEEDMFSKRQKDGAFHLIFNDTWGPPYEPHSYLSSMRVSSHADYQAQCGLAMKKNLDDAIRRALVTLNEKERRESYRYVLETLHHQAVYLPLCTINGMMVHGKNLTGVVSGATKYEIPFERMVKNR